MNHPVELILENFRCFRAEQRGKLRPVTFLVGENGTGKSSFLASYMAIAHCFQESTMNGKPDFNLDPFELGAFCHILHRPVGKKVSESKFKLGVSFSEGCAGIESPDNLHVTFGQSNALPQINSLRRLFGKSEFIELARTASGARVSIPGFSANLNSSISEACKIIEWIGFDSGRAQEDSGKGEFKCGRVYSENINCEAWKKVNEYISSILIPTIRRQYGFKARTQALDILGLESLRQSAEAVVPIAPIRSKPKRKFDLLQEHSNAEGDHIPVLLMRLSKLGKRCWDRFHEELTEFGKSAGLFSDIRVKSCAEADACGPFEIQVKAGTGNFCNIMDAGCGVRQSLLVAASILAGSAVGKERKSTFLLQQPEVRLHPRAQAAMGNLICDAVAKGKSRFMIETHSDYILDRTRIMVRKGILQESDVSILFFEKESTGSSARVFNLKLDSNGNVLDAPNSYRDFFVAEIDKVLGFGD